jgi:hypothetical protein
MILSLEGKYKYRILNCLKVMFILAVKMTQAHLPLIWKAGLICVPDII